MRRPSAPMLISLLALFIALGGTSYAVIKLPRNSVGSREIKDRSVRTSDLAPSTRIGRRGPRGAQGPAGPAGSAAGPTTAPAPPEAWQTLRTIRPWETYGGAWPTAAYRKDAAGRVYLRGLARKRDTAPGVDDTIAILPAGYAPATRLMFTVMMQGNTGEERAGRADILADGSIVWESGPPGLGGYTSLDPISFWSG